MSMEDIHLHPLISFFTILCSIKWYTFTAVCVATKRNGLEGWNDRLCTVPGVRVKGHWVLPLESWKTRQADRQTDTREASRVRGGAEE